MSLRVSIGEFLARGNFIQACKIGDWKTIEKTATLWWRMFNQKTLMETYETEKEAVKTKRKSG